MILIKTLKELYNRDLQKLKNEITLYPFESVMWELNSDIKNSGGNLALHLIGNLKTFIGAGLGDYNYERNRKFEFSGKNVPRAQIISELNETIAIVMDSLDKVSESQMENDFPVVIWEAPRSMIFTLLHLHSHLNYHLGQVNYHRRMLDK